MNCNGICLNIFAALYLMMVLLQFATGIGYATETDDNSVGVNGDLYDVFRERLEKIEKELSGDADLFNIDDHGEKRSASNVCLYEKIKKRLDKFNSELLPLQALHDDGEKSTTTFRQYLFDEYKKQLVKENREISLDGEKNFDRDEQSGFLADTAFQKKEQTKRGENTTSTAITEAVNENKDALTWNDFYNTCRSELDKLIDELYRKERLEKNNKTRVKNLVQLVDEDFFTETELRDGEGFVGYDYGLHNEKFANDRSVYNGEMTLPYGADLSSSYPAVLTKALENSLNSSGATSQVNLLTSVAQKMNTTPLELAKKLTSEEPTSNYLGTPAIMNDPKLSQILQKYIATMKVPDNKVPKGSEESENIMSTAANVQPQAPSMKERDAAVTDDYSNAKISIVLDKVLSKLEHIQQDKNSPVNKGAPEGAPCDIIGSWNSYVLGLQFEISLGKANERNLAAAEINNKLLTIEVDECSPPKHHEIMDTEWSYMGSALKQLGGPFYIYSQKRDDSVMATFSGFCRTCNGMDTIFGSWAFLFPSKDCQDISASIENKRDILRRYEMESKRKARFHDLLYGKSKLPKSKCT